jgi:hypothetical protein
LFLAAQQFVPAPAHPVHCLSLKQSKVSSWLK